MHQTANPTFAQSKYRDQSSIRATIWSFDLKLQLKARIWFGGRRFRSFDLEAFDLEAVGLEAWRLRGLEAFDIAFIVSNQDHIGHESSAYLNCRALIQSLLLRICIQFNLNFNLKPYILNILDYMITKLLYSLVELKQVYYPNLIRSNTHRRW